MSEPKTGESVLNTGYLGAGRPLARTTFSLTLVFTQQLSSMILARLTLMLVLLNGYAKERRYSSN